MLHIVVRGCTCTAAITVSSCLPHLSTVATHHQPFSRFLSTSVALIFCCSLWDPDPFISHPSILWLYSHAHFLLSANFPLHFSPTHFICNGKYCWRKVIYIYFFSNRKTADHKRIQPTTPALQHCRLRVFEKVRHHRKANAWQRDEDSASQRDS